jgi:deoxyadenosine/deoxycytidine kinase
LQHSLLGLLRSLLHQLLSHSALNVFRASSLPLILSRLQKQGQPGEKWNWLAKNLRDHVLQLSRAYSTDRRLYLYIDAVDECNSNERQDLLQLLQQLFADTQTTQIRLCASSRPQPFLRLPAAERIFVEEENVQDIAAYID